MRFQIFFLFLSRSIFHWLHWGILYFFLGAGLEEKFATQNGRFEEFLYSNVLVKYYGIQWLLEEKIFLKKPPLSVLSL